MNNQDMKIYFDGSHYIGIPKGAFPSKKGRKRRVVKPMQQTQKEQTVETPPETTKECFEKAYKESQSLPKKERKAHIKESLKDHFDSKEELNAYVDENVERAKTNAKNAKYVLCENYGYKIGISFVRLPTQTNFTPRNLSARSYPTH